jgi:hypothetical protein
MHSREILNIVEQKVQEGQILEFKGDPPYVPGDVGRREILKDVTGLANAEGGTLLLGISQDSAGRASGVCGVADADAVVGRIRDTLLGNLKPRSLKVAIDVVLVTGKPVIVVKVPKAAPHVARYEEDGKPIYKRRHADRVRDMSHEELEELIGHDKARSESRENAIKTRLQSLRASTSKAVGTQYAYALYCATTDGLSGVQLANRSSAVDTVIQCLRHPRTNVERLMTGDWGAHPSANGGLAYEAPWFRRKLSLDIFDGAVIRHIATGPEAFYGSIPNWEGTLPLHPFLLAGRALVFFKTASEVLSALAYQGRRTIALDLFCMNGAKLVAGNLGSPAYLHAGFGSPMPGTVQAFPQNVLATKPVCCDPNVDPLVAASFLVRQIYISFGFREDHIAFWKDGRLSLS